MRYRLLDILACPYCKGRLKVDVFLKSKNNFKLKGYDEEIEEGILKCRCGRVYPIIKAVPRILPEELMKELLNDYSGFFERYKEKFGELKAEKKTRIAKDKIKVARSFGYEWKNFSKLYKEYEKQFLGWIYPVKHDFFKGKLVMDAGCGTGRHIYYAARYGAEIVGFDLGEAVDVAYQNTKQFPKAHVVQADIYHLPFKKKEFDYVYCIGVLHHLPKPKEGFRNLLGYIKKGGHISAWVYGREGNYLLRIIDPLRKHIISKLPLEIVDGMAFLMMLILHPVFKLVYKPLNSSRFFRPITKFLPQNSFFYYLSGFSFRQNHSILFDQLLAPIANYYKKEEFEEWFKVREIGEVMITWRNRNSWRGFAHIED
jgi:uncharacterized protein YbaR (Trm112 family)/SAM-dependent methyltransferase